MNVSLRSVPKLLRCNRVSIPEYRHFLRSGSQKLLQNCSLSVCHQMFDSIHYLSKIKVFSENYKICLKS